MRVKSNTLRMIFGAWYLQGQKPTSYRANGLPRVLLDWTDCTKWQGQAERTNKT